MARRGRLPIWIARSVLVVAVSIALVGPLPARVAATGSGLEAPSRPRAVLLVKYRSEGPHSVDDCAERLSRTDEPFARATRDGSDSLDRLRRRFRLGRHRALFRTPDSTSLSSQRRVLAERLSRLDQRAARSRRSRPLPDLSHVYRVTLPDPQSIDDAVAALAADPHVEYAQLDHSFALDQIALPPNDPFFSSSGSWGQAFSDLWGLERIRAPQAWAIEQGEGAVVAVVDSGLDRFHADIRDNLWINAGEDLDGDGQAEPEDQNGLDDDGNGFIDDLTGFDFANSSDRDEDGTFDGEADVSDADPFDDNGHGSHVAGTIAATGGNGIGVIGVAPRARIMALKGFPAQGAAFDSVLWRAVLYAAENGATVVNNSWSCAPACPENPLAEEVLAIVNALGTVVVTSAGNDSSDVLFTSPENRTSVLTVGSIGSDGRISDFSNRGWLLDVVAPGGGPDQPVELFLPSRNILSLLSSGALPDRLVLAVAGPYLRLSGTSMSSPHVAGAVALLRANRPELSPRDVRRLIRMSASDLGAPGHDPVYGAGLLDLARLLEEDLPALDLEIESPGPGAVHDPSEGDLILRGRASGSDLESIVIEVGAGLMARTFRPLEDWGDSIVEPIDSRPAGEQDDSRALARWDVSEVPDGPHVIRIRARLRDGRNVEEHAIVGIERNPSIALSDGELEVGGPSLSRRQLVWHVDESNETPQEHDLAIGVFPTHLPRSSSPLEAAREVSPAIVLARAGDQRNVVSAGNELAWITRDRTDRSIERCRLRQKTRDSQPRSSPAERPNLCEPERVVSPPSSFTGPWIGPDWLLWMRFDGSSRTIEGCRIGPKHPVCRPQSLLDPAADRRWSLESYDGETLVLTRPGELARCALTGKAPLCTPEPIELESESPPPSEPIHDGNLLVFSDLSVRTLPDPDCGGPGSCPSRAVLTRALYACWIDEVTRFCDPIRIAPPVSVDDSAGVAVSGRRIIWSAASPNETPSLRSCEFLPELSSCRSQRLTGSAAPQTRPDLDELRIVWEDSRTGIARIRGLELPDLVLPARVRWRAGMPFVLPIFGRPGGSRTLHFEVEPIDGLSPAEAQAKIATLDPTGRAGWLKGVIPPGATGQARWKIRAIENAGLFSERVLTIVIDPPGPRRKPTERPLDLDASAQRR